MKSFFVAINYSSLMLLFLTFIGYWIVNLLICKCETLFGFENKFRWYDILTILFFFLFYLFMLLQMGSIKNENEINQLKTTHELEMKKIQENHIYMEKILNTIKEKQ